MNSGRAAIFAAMLACALFAFPAAAQTTTSRTDLYLVIEPSVGEEPVSRTVLKDAAILRAEARSPRAVRLLEDVTVGTLGSGVNFKSGDILYGRYDNSVWTYCGTASLNGESRVASAAVLGVLTAGFSLLLEPMMGGPLINCMHDSDADGQFDTGWGGGNAATENDMLAFSVTKKTLSAPTSYETVDPALGPRMPVEIKWAKSGNAGTITFRVEVGGRRIASTTKAVPAKGAEPVEVKLFGAVILLEGYDAASESIRVQVQEGIGHNYMRIPAVLTITYY